MPVIPLLLKSYPGDGKYKSVNWQLNLSVRDVPAESVPQSVMGVNVNCPID